MNPHTKTFGVGVKLPTLRLLRTRYPDLAGVLLRDWAREGCLVASRYRRETGFHLVGARPRWSWVIRLIFGCWLGYWGRPASGAQLALRRKAGDR